MGMDGVDVDRVDVDRGRRRMGMGGRRFLIELGAWVSRLGCG